MLQKIYFMVFERYIPELKKYGSILFLHQPITSGQPLKIVQRHMAHPVDCQTTWVLKHLRIISRNVFKNPVWQLHIPEMIIHNPTGIGVHLSYTADQIILENLKMMEGFCFAIKLSQREAYSTHKNWVGALTTTIC